MSAPSLTLRSLQNEETGIDISVPCFQEEEAPLGGTSVLYEIAVLTKLDVYKTRLHGNEDVVQFSVFKAYREVEDLYNKLNKKYPKADLPSVPRSSTLAKYTNEDKVAALDRLLKAVSKNIELCHSSIFTHFIGINSQRSSSFTVIKDTSDVDLESENAVQSKKHATGDLSEVFPKVKNTVSKTENKVTESVPVRNKIDLFEEVKLVKESEKNCALKKGSSTGGLFDDFEDDSLFSTVVTPKPVSPPKQENKTTEVKQRKKEPEKKVDDVIVDDSEIIIKDRKLGNISLFDELDLGDHINKDEEALFLVSAKNEKSKKNNLLFSSDSVTVESDSGLHENLDDLLNLNPLPSTPATKKSSSSTSTETELKIEDKPVSTEENIEHQFRKPVPLPRKKSFGKNDTEEHLTMSRPEVMPRKVFLAKPEVPTKPVSATKEVKRPTKPPPISAKPSLPNKPKPPPKAPKPTLEKITKDLDAINANQPEKLRNQTFVSPIADDLNKLDILKYIEQEQKSLESKPSLFD